jgi:hypothetical protein
LASSSIRTKGLVTVSTSHELHTHTHRARLQYSKVYIAVYIYISIYAQWIDIHQLERIKQKGGCRSSSSHHHIESVRRWLCVCVVMRLGGGGPAIDFPVRVPHTHTQHSWRSSSLFSFAPTFYFHYSSLRLSLLCRVSISIARPPSIIQVHRSQRPRPASLYGQNLNDLDRRPSSIHVY